MTDPTPIMTCPFCKVALTRGLCPKCGNRFDGAFGDMIFLKKDKENEK